MSKIKANLNLEITLDGDQITVTGTGERCQCVCPGPDPTPEPPVPDPEPPVPVPEPPAPEPPPVDTSLKQFTIGDLFVTKQGSEQRGWEFPSPTFARSKTRIYNTIKEADGSRNLWVYTQEDDTKVKLRDNIIQACVNSSAGKYDTMSYIYLNDKQSYSLGRATPLQGDGLSWDFKEVSSANLVKAPYKLGDIHARLGDDFWFKGHMYTDNDYIRQFHFNGEPININYPTPSDGLRYEIYQFSVFKPEDRGWKSKRKYVALVGLFKILSQSRWQKGPIDMVWATSDDGLNWDLPYGAEQAVYRDPSKDTMHVPGSNLIPYGNELRVYYADLNFSHNTYNQATDPQIGTRMASLSKADFESMFG